MLTDGLLCYVKRYAYLNVLTVAAKIIGSFLIPVQAKKFFKRASLFCGWLYVFRTWSIRFLPVIF